jgi:hypothetical protein
MALSCIDCNTDLHDGNWTPSGQKFGHRVCRACVSERRRVRYLDPVYAADRAKWHREYRERNRDAKALVNRAWRLRDIYGMTEADFVALLAEQGGRCRLCKTDNSRDRRPWHIDHCHQTGRVRGILCAPCNKGLGMMGDDPAMLRRAAAYLEAHK